MRLAIAKDFQAIEGLEVVMTIDERFGLDDCVGEAVAVRPGEEELVLARFSAACDYTVLIAPETGGVLKSRVERIEQSGGRTLGSTSAAVALTTDKQKLSEHLTRRGVRTPLTTTIQTPSDLSPRFSYPAVLKPIDGAGATDTFLLRGPTDESVPRLFTGPMVLQPFCEGTAMSATFLVGPTGKIRLVGVGEQRISIDNGAILYQGGRLPAPTAFALEAPLDAVRSVPGLRGVCGVDFVRNVGTGLTTVIEINPRPTTSYVGLSHLLPAGTIARAWLDAFRAPATDDDLRGMIDPEASRRVRFSPDGLIFEVEPADGE